MIQLRLLTTLIANHAIPVRPSKINRKTPRHFDSLLDKERNLVERYFQQLNNCRRLATRYEQLARNYQAMLNWVATVIWLN
jgi:transposase